MADIEELWSQYAGEIRSYVRRRCGDRELAEDITNETFLQASRAIDRDKDVSVSWLITVARRRLIDHWRAGSRHAAALDALAKDRSLLVEKGPAQIDRSLESPELYEALGTLCGTQRNALLLRYCCDWTVCSVAGELNLSYRAAESVLSRGRKKLRAEYLASTS